MSDKSFSRYVGIFPVSCEGAASSFHLREILTRLRRIFFPWSKMGCAEAFLFSSATSITPSTAACVQRDKPPILIGFGNVPDETQRHIVDFAQWNISHRSSIVYKYWLLSILISPMLSDADIVDLIRSLRKARVLSRFSQNCVIGSPIDNLFDEKSDDRQLCRRLIRRSLVSALCTASRSAYSAQRCINFRRRSKRSERAYALSV
ncbi:hypothetical protein IQ03_03739 [Gemmobacter caeni]|uniref:Uncharacterized protein n=1 Tax=Gemmobacter caeni TaxID=589035 RepID=A0A2T6AS29_9RHOB|nr:hypothetical protein C8N34_116104 [Gemmobacter caeni]TWI95476.1 hypothetical protein IQ03_03739 [Gemmobacter caeni]